MLRGLAQAAKGPLKRALRSALRPSPGSEAGLSPQYWGLARGADGALSLEGVSLPELGAREGLPLHVVSRARLRNNVRRFLATPPGSESACEVFYSYKTNPVPGVLSELHALGMGAEVISHYELWLARSLGVPPEKIVYNGPAKSEASIREAVAAGIQLLNCNHREEIAVVARIASEAGRRLRVGLRVTIGSGWSGQFGVPVAGGHALAAYAEALAAGSLDVVALHAHRGGMIRSEAELEAFVEPVLAFADALRERLGLRLSVLDFGGSLATPSVRPLAARELRLNRTFFRPIAAPDPQATLPIERYVGLVLERVAEHYRRQGEPAPRVFLEPGRSVTGDAQALLSSVLTLKHEGERSYAVMDAGINLAESCRSEYHQILSANRSGQRATDVYTIVGPICTPGDTLYGAVRLPELRPGDTLLIMDSGAYFVPFATSFSFPQPAVVMIDQGAVQTIRRAERFVDLVAYDQPAMAPSQEVGA